MLSILWSEYNIIENGTRRDVFDKITSGCGKVRTEHSPNGFEVRSNIKNSFCLGIRGEENLNPRRSIHTLHGIDRNQESRNDSSRHGIDLNQESRNDSVQTPTVTHPLLPGNT